MIEEVVLLPLVKRFIKLRLQLCVVRTGQIILRHRVNFGRLAQRGLIKRKARAPRPLAKAVQVHTTEIIQPHAKSLLIKGQNARHMRAHRRQTTRRGHKLRIVPPCHRVNHQDHRPAALLRPDQAVEVTVGAAFDDGLHRAGKIAQFRKLFARENEQRFVFGRHRQVGKAPFMTPAPASGKHCRLLSCPRDNSGLFARHPPA